MYNFTLISAGAVAQKEFSMKDGFEVIRYKKHDLPRVRVVVPGKYAMGSSQPYEFDVIEFKKFGDNTTGEYLWMGYSSKLNILGVVFEETP